MKRKCSCQEYLAATGLAGDSKPAGAEIPRDVIVARQARNSMDEGVLALADVTHEHRWRVSSHDLFELKQDP